MAVFVVLRPQGDGGHSGQKREQAHEDRNAESLSVRSTLDKLAAVQLWLCEWLTEVAERPGTRVDRARGSSDRAQSDTAWRGEARRSVE